MLSYHLVCRLSLHIPGFQEASMVANHQRKPKVTMS